MTPYIFVPNYRTSRRLIPEVSNIRFHGNVRYHVHYCVYHCPSLYLIVFLLRFVLILSSHLSPCLPISPFLSRFSSILYSFQLLHTCHLSCTLNPPLLDHPNHVTSVRQCRHHVCIIPSKALLTASNRKNRLPWRRAQTAPSNQSCTFAWDIENTENFPHA
jgi:hypothetical protein